VAPPPARTPAPPDAKAILVRKLSLARRIAAREKPVAAIDRAFTYVKVMRALV
jgi:hypothetical protein